MVIDDDDIVTDLLTLSDMQRIAESTYIRWAANAQEHLDEVRPDAQYVIPRYEDLPTYLRNGWNEIVEDIVDRAMVGNEDDS